MPKFSVFHEFEEILSPAELNQLNSDLLKIIKKIRRFIRIGMLSVLLGIISFILFGYYFPYYDIWVLHGWADMGFIIISSILIGVPFLLFLVFGSLAERIKNFYAVSEFFAHHSSEKEFYILFNAWGQKIKKTPFHLGGLILTQNQNNYVGGSIKYSKSTTTFYDPTNKRNRFKNTYFACISIFRIESGESIKKWPQNKDQPISLLEKATTLFEFNARRYYNQKTMQYLETLRTELIAQNIHIG